IGYAQVLDAMDESLHIDDEGRAWAQDRTFIGTRRYVRRQRSWFGRDHRIRWISTDTRDRDPSPLEDALRLLGARQRRVRSRRLAGASNTATGPSRSRAR